MNLSEDVEIKLINFNPGVGDEVKKIPGTTFISGNYPLEIYGLFQIFKDGEPKDLNLRITHVGFNDYHKDVVEVEDIQNRVRNICENSVEELTDIIRNNYKSFPAGNEIQGTIKGKFVANNKLEFESLINFY